MRCCLKWARHSRVIGIISVIWFLVESVATVSSLQPRKHWLTSRRKSLETINGCITNDCGVWLIHGFCNGVPHFNGRCFSFYIEEIMRWCSCVLRGSVGRLYHCKFVVLVCTEQPRVFLLLESGSWIFLKLAQRCLDVAWFFPVEPCHTLRLHHNIPLIIYLLSDDTHRTLKPEVAL